MTTTPDVFAALASPVRRQLLVRLKKGPRTVTLLARGLAIGRPAVSEHLQVLRKTKLVREVQRGRERYYHLDPRPMAKVDAFVSAFSQYWRERLVDLEAVLAEEVAR